MTSDCSTTCVHRSRPLAKPASRCLRTASALAARRLSQLGHPNSTQRLVEQRHTFARCELVGEWHPDFVPQDGDIVIQEHWGQSGFANTDLDFQLKQQGITHVIVVGLLANTCIESTARFAMELGYHVTLVRDATAAFSKEMMHAAHHLNGPTFAHEILTTAELVTALAVASQGSAA